MANNPPYQNQDQNGYPIPDLTSILATLAQFAPQQAPTPTSLFQNHPFAPPPASTTPPGDPQIQSVNLDTNSLLQSLFAPAISSNATSATPAAAVQSLPSQQSLAIPQDPRLRGRSRTHTPDPNSLPQVPPQVIPHGLPGLGGLEHAQSTLPRPQQRGYDGRPSMQQSQPIGQGAGQGFVIDPATITEWTAGLRCVNKIAVQNRDFAAAIKRMITNQQKHEMQWYQGRQELKQMQARRATGATEIHNILSSLGTHPSQVPPTPAAQQTPEDKEAELLAFDQKIYRAQLAMQDNMTAELKGLGVPFFGTNADRLVADDQNAETNDGDKGGQPKWSPRVTREELLALQRKILAYLEDMYKE